MTEAQLAAQKFNDGTIIASSPIREQKGMEPSRIVLRKVQFSYVVHLQVFPGPDNEYRNPYYVQGDYVWDGDDRALPDSWVNFDRRVRNLFDMQPTTKADRRKPVSV